MISTSVPNVPVIPHIPFIPFVLKIPAVLSVSFVSDVSRELICTGRTSCTLGTDDTLDTFGPSRPVGTSPSLAMSFLTKAMKNHVNHIAVTLATILEQLNVVPLLELEATDVSEKLKERLSRIKTLDLAVPEVATEKDGTSLYSLAPIY